MIRFLLRLFSYLFNAGLSLALLALGVVALLAGAPGFKLDMIPWWEGAALAKVVLAGGLVGAIATWCAVRGSVKGLLPVWNLVTLGVMVFGYYLGSYHFGGMEEFRTILWTTAGNVIAFLGSLSQVFRK
ncbi:MAG: hypothetical protein R2729_19400 [Bryobacteraceae bacterium]